MKPAQAECPECGRECHDFLIFEGRCDHCRLAAERAEAVPHECDMTDIRGERARLLAATDWSQLADVPEPVKQKWRPYRQALRDLPGKVTNPKKVPWPEPPA